MRCPDEAARTGEPIAAFGMFTDTHYSERVYGDRYCHDSLEKLHACVETFNEKQMPIAFCLGDLVDGAGDEKSELGYLSAMAEAYAQFQGGRYFVLGNHDVGSLTKREFLENCRAQPASCYYSFDQDGLHFAVLDGNCHEDGSDFARGDFEWENAWVSEAQLEWLAADLAAAERRPAVLLCHENLDHRLWNDELDPHIVRNATAVRSVFEQAGNVVAVIQGHYHPGMHTVLNGIPYIMLSAMGVGPSLENNAYAIVTVCEDGSVSVEGFGRQESFLTDSRQELSS